MKRFFYLFPLTLAVLFQSCENLFPIKRNAELVFTFDRASVVTRSASIPAIPDTNDFILTVLDSHGVEIYNGKYGAVPESLSVPAGSISVKVRSIEAEMPAFDCPVYGDDQLVLTSSGQVCNVVLECSQLNSGIRLIVSSDFLEQCPDDVLQLKSGDGNVVYTYMERRIAYFNPGAVSVVLSGPEGERVLMTDFLEAREILTVNVKVSADGGLSMSGPFSIAVDTSRIWNSAECLAGGVAAGPGETFENAISASQARSMAGLSSVWVYGYVVGGDLTSTKMSFEPPFSSRTNIAIATKSSVLSRDNCLSVQLSKGDFRDSLNLVDNPGLLGRMVFLRGDLVDSYYGIPGIRNIVDCRIK